MIVGSPQSLCHFDTTIFNSQFHPARIVPSLPDVEVPTPAMAHGERPRAPAAAAATATAASPAVVRGTPGTPIEKYAEYPTALTASAQKHVREGCGSGCDECEYRRNHVPGIRPTRHPWDLLSLCSSFDLMES
jgi:hypothetical protein